MPLKIVLHAEIMLPSIWGSKQDWDDVALREDGTYDLDFVAELLDEDPLAAIEAVGTPGASGVMGRLLRSAEWVTE